MNEFHDNPYVNWSDEELGKAERQIIDLLWHRRKIREMDKIRTLNINGITVKDFVVFYAPVEAGSRPYFSFFIARDGKLYDIYYDTCDRYLNLSSSPWYPWWPTVDGDGEPCSPVGKAENEVYNGAYSFIPSGFLEACENCYEYGIETDKAIETLKKHGFEVVIKATLEDQGNYQEIYTEWLNENKQTKIV